MQIDLGEIYQIYGLDIRGGYGKYTYYKGKTYKAKSKKGNAHKGKSRYRYYTTTFKLSYSLRNSIMKSYSENQTEKVK